MIELSAVDSADPRWSAKVFNGILLVAEFQLIKTKDAYVMTENSGRTGDTFCVLTDDGAIVHVSAEWRYRIEHVESAFKKFKEAIITPQYFNQAPKTVVEDAGDWNLL